MRLLGVRDAGVDRKQPRRGDNAGGVAFSAPELPPVVISAPPELPEFRMPFDVTRKSKGEKRLARAERRRKGWR